MSCTTCKQKANIKEEMNNAGSFVSKGVIIFAIVWSGLGIYGLISLIQKFL
jgi:hypothetical protein